MENAIYAALIAGLAWVVGASAFGSYILARVTLLSKTKKAKKHYRNRSLFKGAFAGTSGILLWRVIIAQTADPTIWAWGYLVGLLVAGYAATALAREATDELADLEAEEEKGPE